VEWVEFFVGSVSKMCSHQVFNLFLSGSQNVPQVPNVFPKTFTVAPHFFGVLMLFGQGNSMYRPGRGLVMCKGCFYFGEGIIFRLLCWGVPHVPRILVMSQ
jgi:hypothetical protein